MDSKSILYDISFNMRIYNTVQSLSTKKEIKPKERVKRQIVQNNAWAFTPNVIQNQKEILHEIQHHPNDSEYYFQECKFFQTQIAQKRNGYKYQDIEKGLYSADEFIQAKEIIELLSSSNLMCYYCREPVLLVYEYVRDSRQWTLERIDNTRGHNRGNIVIACLGCNLRRKTMYHERFAFTKQMNVVKKN